MLFLNIIVKFAIMTHTGFFERYFITPFFRRERDFSGEENALSAWRSVLAWLVVTAGVAGALLGFVGLLGPEVGFVCLEVVGVVWICGSALGFAAMISRLSRSGRNEDNREKEGKLRFLGIDKLLTAVCLLFLVLGFLMMITTLNSGELNMNPRRGGAGEPNPILEQDSIWEEPIFTYQDVKPQEPVKDTLTDLVDKDTVSLDESFDPEIATAAPVEIDTAAIEM